MQFLNISGGSAEFSLDMEDMWELAKLALGMPCPGEELGAGFHLFQAMGAACEAATFALMTAGGIVGGHRFSLAKLIRADSMHDPALLREWYGDSGQSISPDEEDGKNQDAVR